MTGVRKVIDEFKSENRNGQHDDVINGYHGLFFFLKKNILDVRL